MAAVEECRVRDQIEISTASAQGIYYLVTVEEVERSIFEAEQSLKVVGLE